MTNEHRWPSPALYGVTVGFYRGGSGGLEAARWEEGSSGIGPLQVAAWQEAVDGWLSSQAQNFCFVDFAKSLIRPLLKSGERKSLIQRMLMSRTLDLKQAVSALMRTLSCLLSMKMN